MSMVRIIYRWYLKLTMPELPEVETIRIQLDKFLIGHTVEKVEVKNRRILASGENLLIGGKVIKVRRFGKVTVVDLDNGYSFLVHVKLTGQFIYRGPNLKKPLNLSNKVVGVVPGKHTHVIFYFDRGGILYYNDIRQFGWIKIVQSAKLKAQNEFIGKLGPEPLVTKSSSGQTVLTLDLFKNILSKSKRP